MRMPEAGPLGETFFDARALAMVDALSLKSPWSGWVESVVTFADHFFFVAIGASWVGASFPKMRADDFVLVGDDCAYRDFAVGVGGLGFGDGGSEVGEVGHACWRTCGLASGPKNRAICSARALRAGRRRATSASSSMKFLRQMAS